VDLAALRRSPIAAALPGEGAAQARARFGFDPRTDLDRALLAAGSERPGPPELLLVLSGRIEDEHVLAALRAQARPSERERRGRAVYGLTGGGHLLLPAPGLLVIVSDGWLERVLDRLEGRGRGALEARELATAVRAVGPGHTAWLALAVAPGSAGVLAAQVGWTELKELRSLRAALDAGQTLTLEVAARLAAPAAASALERRLREEVRRGSDLLEDVRLRVEGEELRGRLALSTRGLEKLWQGLGRGRQ